MQSKNDSQENIIETQSIYSV